MGSGARAEHVEAGANERLDGLQAAVLGVKLPRLVAADATCWRIAAAYREWLKGEVRLLEERPATPCVYHLFPIRTPERDVVARRMRAAGVATGLHDTPALHRQPALEGHVRAATELPNAEAWAAEELSLPMSPALTDAEVLNAADACLAALADVEQLEPAHA